MNLGDWIAALCTELSNRLERVVEPRPDEGGWFRVDLGSYGLLVMDEDDSEALIWLLDREGRTGGPVWAGDMNQGTISAAAMAAAEGLNDAPSAAAFTARAPTHGDVVLENTVNDLWEDVTAEIDRLYSFSRGRFDVKAATIEIERYIDKLVHTVAGGSAGAFSEPFKVQAATLIRDRSNSKR